MDTIEFIRNIFRSEGVEIKKNILVLPHTKSFPFEPELDVDIVSRSKYSYIRPFDFNWNKMRGYFAEYILNGLRIENDDDFYMILLFLYLHEFILMSENRYISYRINNGTNSFFYLNDVKKLIQKYIEDNYEIYFLGNEGHSSKILEMNRMSFIKDITFDDENVFLECLCKLCILSWNEVLLKSVILERKKSDLSFSDPLKYYDPDWLGYFVCSKKKFICCDSEFKMIEHIVLERRFSNKLIQSCEIVYLDENTLNVRHENIVLFKSEGDVIRFREGNNSYSEDTDGVFYFENEVEGEEFIKLYNKYTSTKLSEICKLSPYYLKKKIIDYGLLDENN